VDELIRAWDLSKGKSTSLAAGYFQCVNIKELRKLGFRYPRAADHPMTSRTRHKFQQSSDVRMRTAIGGTFRLKNLSPAYHLTHPRPGEEGWKDGVLL
jgi:hypothetical protein